MIQTGLTYFVCFFCFIEVTMIGTELLNIFEKYHIDAGQSKQVEQILKEQNLLETLRTVTPMEKGMTNRSFLATGDQKYLIRFSGEGTGNIINRKQEADVYHQLAGKDISDEVLYINPDNGIKISKYLEESHVCSMENEEDVKACIRYLRKFHDMKLEVNHAFDLYAEIRLYEGQCGMYFDAFPDVRETREKIMSLRELIKNRQTQNCLCHIDPVYDNFLVQKDAIHLIDWEYSGMSDPLLDVAMFCIYANLDKEKTDRVIEIYLEERDCKEYRMLIYAYMAASSYLWVLWSEIKWLSGVDFREYEESQYMLAKEYYQYALDAYERK